MSALAVILAITVGTRRPTRPCAAACRSGQRHGRPDRRHRGRCHRRPQPARREPWSPWARAGMRGSGEQVLRAGDVAAHSRWSAPDRPRPPDRRRDADPGPRQGQADEPADSEAHAGPESGAQADGPAPTPKPTPKATPGPDSRRSQADARTDAHAPHPRSRRVRHQALAVPGAAHVPAAAARPRQPRRRPGRAAIDCDAPRGELPADRDPVARGARHRTPSTRALACSASSPPRRTTGCASECSTRSSRSR